MSRLYNYFLGCWKNGTITQTQLETAVSKGYITEQEKETIIASQ